MKQDIKDTASESKKRKQSYMDSSSDAASISATSKQKPLAKSEIRPIST